MRSTSPSCSNSPRYSTGCAPTLRCVPSSSPVAARAPSAPAPTFANSTAPRRSPCASSPGSPSKSIAASRHWGNRWSPRSTARRWVAAWNWPRRARCASPLAVRGSATRKCRSVPSPASAAPPGYRVWSAAVGRPKCCCVDALSMPTRLCRSAWYRVSSPLTVSSTRHKSSLQTSSRSRRPPCG